MFANGEYAQIEAPDEDVFRSPEFGNALFLVLARNDMATLAILRSALTHGRSIGVVGEATLGTLDCTPVRQYSDRLHTLNGVSVPGRRVVCFTSGSTGEAKGILRTLTSWRRTFDVQRRVFSVTAETTPVIIGSLEHSLHLYGAVEAMDRGVTPLVMPRFVPKHFADLCGRHKKLLIYATPSHINLMLSFAERQGSLRLESVVQVFCGGAKLDERRMARIHAVFPAAEIVEFFGTTETSFVTFKAAGAPRGSIGKAFPTVRIKIRGDDGRELPPGQVGTLWVESPMLFERYVIGADPQTKWDGAFVTVGDQGYLDEEGHFYFTERKGSMVTVAGLNVSLDEVENRLKAMLPEGECAVVAISDALRGKCLMAATQVSVSEAEGARALRGLREQFGPLIAPKALVSFADWPLLPSGKTNRDEIVRRLVRNLG